MRGAPADGSASYCLGCEPVWHFDDQGSKNIMTEGHTLRSGDHVQHTCIFDSTGRSEPTVFGEETLDEMCWGQFTYLPDHVDASCDKDVPNFYWFGALAVGEDVMGLREKHPRNEADAVLDGASGITGGRLVRYKDLDGNMVDVGTGMSGPVVCGENRAMKNLCQQAMPMLISNGIGCETDMSIVRPQLPPGITPLGGCCALACDQLCPDHAECQVTDA